MCSSDLWPSQVTLTAGADRPALVRLTEKGLYRWYAGCCRTPVANTISPKLPFVGVLRNFIAATDAELDARFGPATGVQGRFAVGGCPPGAHASASFAIIAASIGLLTSGYWAGGARPTPLFREDGTPVTQAYVLTMSEREALPR